MLFKLWQWFIPPEVATARFTVTFGVVLMTKLLTFRSRRKPLTNANHYRALGDQAVSPLNHPGGGLGWHLAIRTGVAIISSKYRPPPTLIGTARDGRAAQPALVFIGLILLGHAVAAGARPGAVRTALFLSAAR